MNRKTIIEIVIAVAAFSASGVVLYRGLHTAPPPAQQPVAATPQSTASILPYGSNLNFDILRKQGFEFNAYNYPKLEPSTDVGVPVDTLIQPAPSQP